MNKIIQRHLISATVITLFTFLTTNLLRAQLVIPEADGSDGTFSPTENVTVDLSLANTAGWDTPSTTPGNGVYDSDKWAVVFKYSSVDIPANVTVTFSNHPSRAPVVWLVNGTVNVAGTIDVSGKTSGANNELKTSEPGPGGFRGGLFRFNPSFQGPGFGPGGQNRSGLVGRYLTEYGNSQILPLIGGSGGGGVISGAGTFPGGGGGGAILIAATTSIDLSGSILANGSSWASGGAVRLLTEQLNGTGVIKVEGSEGADFGRIRLEANSFSGGLVTNPSTIIVLPDNPPLIWPPVDSPTVKIISIEGQSVPEDPRAEIVPNADIQQLNSDLSEVILQTTNLLITSTVTVRVIPKFADSFSVDAIYVSGDESVSTWSAMVSLPQNDFAVIQAHARSSLNN